MSASTGSPAGRSGAAPLARAPAGLRDAVDALDELEVEARAQLQALPPDRGGALAASGLRTLARLRRERAGLRRSLRLLPARPLAVSPGRSPDLDGLRAALSDVTYGYADAIAAAREGSAVGVLVDHLKEAARLLAVVELWIDEELRRA